MWWDTRSDDKFRHNTIHHDMRRMRKYEDMKHEKRRCGKIKQDDRLDEIEKKYLMKWDKIRCKMGWHWMRYNVRQQKI